MADVGGLCLESCRDCRVLSWLGIIWPASFVPPQRQKETVRGTPDGALMTLHQMTSMTHSPRHPTRDMCPLYPIQQEVGGCPPRGFPNRGAAQPRLHSRGNRPPSVLLEHPQPCPRCRDSPVRLRRLVAAAHPLRRVCLLVVPDCRPSLVSVLI